MRVSRTISIYRAQRSQQGCSLSLGMLRLAEPPTGRARLRSSLKSPRNPITPFETSRVATLHPELYTMFREGARRVIGRAMCGNSFHRLRAVPLPRGGRSLGRGDGGGGTSKFLREGAKGPRGDRKAPIGNRRQGRRPWPAGEPGGWRWREGTPSDDCGRELLPPPAGGARAPLGLGD